MESEALEVLQMVRDGKLTPEQGSEMLQALEAHSKSVSTPGEGRPRFVRVRVNVKDKEDDVNVNFNLPIALAELGLKLAQGAKISRRGETIVLGEYLKELSGVDLFGVMQMVKEGAEGKLVDVDVGGNDEEKVKVEVSVD
ncbi:MAG: hypothetical protein GTO55_02525 [Armatimonadetes bacterium]|nr:hypothetical protein [Armatimonadota bacterium]NIM23155.1 hypothetical protein [Armatimonadota bacterium]NIM67023.1 hypothetical protein [Armatimonadota bacterium]NIM75557.1 hypothetical protein [Armatimonadota bacterium]NIN05212.1 hypothetical protein [Armatimonadota bacterium]